MSINSSMPKSQKENYQNSKKLLLASRIIICNYVLPFTLKFFTIVWRGYNAILRRMRATIHNCLQLGKEQLTHAMVSWQECCHKRNIVDFVQWTQTLPKTNLLYKWFVKAMELGESNLQLMLLFRLVRLNPHRSHSQGVGLNWLTCEQHKGLNWFASKVWGHIGKA